MNILWGDALLYKQTVNSSKSLKWHCIERDTTCHTQSETTSITVSIGLFQFKRPKAYHTVTLYKMKKHYSVNQIGVPAKLNCGKKHIKQLDLWQKKKICLFLYLILSLGVVEYKHSNVSNKNLIEHIYIGIYHQATTKCVGGWGGCYRNFKSKS